MPAKKTEDDAAAEAAEATADQGVPTDATETIAGGMYVVDGKLVNAEGKEITKTGKVKE